MVVHASQLCDKEAHLSGYSVSMMTDGYQFTQELESRDEWYRRGGHSRDNTSLKGWELVRQESMDSTVRTSTLFL